ncbi:uncharacterized protein LOC114040945 [Vombatus ursinus]|uniref:uncharacterized protein LOC114040945 n=1 Tax=Vombatus ursinus TaxID=29139 RepID=UPI000FFD2459|nr:uncharacterized protein LOC114040945 [Vombatus ursinus]
MALSLPHTQLALAMRGSPSSSMCASLESTMPRWKRPFIEDLSAEAGWVTPCWLCCREASLWGMGWINTGRDVSVGKAGETSQDLTRRRSPSGELAGLHPRHRAPRGAGGGGVTAARSDPPQACPLQHGMTGAGQGRREEIGPAGWGGSRRPGDPLPWSELGRENRASPRPAARRDGGDGNAPAAASPEGGARLLRETRSAQQVPPVGPGRGPTALGKLTQAGRGQPAPPPPPPPPFGGSAAVGVGEGGERQARLLFPEASTAGLGDPRRSVLPAARSSPGWGRRGSDVAGRRGEGGTTSGRLRRENLR